MAPQTPIILSSIAHYLPGSKSGGPLVSVRNIVAGLGGSFDFRLLTADHDLGDSTPYPDITPDAWHDVGRAKVRYLTPKARKFLALCKAISQTEHDLLYLNSFFASWATVYPLLGRRLGLVPRKPLLLAPRGEFSKGALALHATKKKAYILAAKRLGLLRDVQWHASTTFEAEDIVRTIGPDAKIFVASDLPDQPPSVLPGGPRDDDPLLHVAFLSRVSPKKNLDFAINLLAGVQVPIHFNIYGPAEDDGYWAMCLNQLKRLPSHVTWQFHGAVPPSQVPSVMRANDLFLLPTHGENYGHVIAEALSVGTRVLISDQTPWRDLAARGLGHDVNLSNPARFREVIEQTANQTGEERLRQRVATHASYMKYLQNNDDMKKNLEMFRDAMSLFQVEGRDHVR